MEKTGAGSHHSEYDRSCQLLGRIQRLNSVLNVLIVNEKLSGEATISESINCFFYFLLLGSEFGTVFCYFESLRSFLISIYATSRLVYFKVCSPE